MKPLNHIVISPKDGNRYNNTDGDFIVNAHIDEHDFKYTQRIGIVEKLPYSRECVFKVGDEVIVHHNVFRRYWGFGMDLRNGDSYFNKEEYVCEPEQVFAYNRGDGWNCVRDYCFVRPIEKEDDIFINEGYKERQGELVYTNESLKKLGYSEGDTIGFSPYSEYVFNIDGETLYKMSTRDIVGVMQ